MTGGARRLLRAIIRGPEAEQIRRDLDDLYDRDRECGVSPARAAWRDAIRSINSVGHVVRFGLSGAAQFFDVTAPRNAVRDIRYAGRTLRRDPAFTIFAVLIVGLGIGVATSVFGVVQALLLRPLPFEAPERLVWIANGDSANLSSQTVQVANLLTLREQSRSLSGIGGFSPFYGVGDVHLTGGGTPERITAVRVTENLFDLLGTGPHLGRFFTADESRWNAPRVVVLSHAFWQRRFEADLSVVGSAISLDGTPAVVIGVLPPQFDFGGIFSAGSPADLFAPFPLTAETNRQGNTLALVGRLTPGVRIDEAAAEARTIGGNIQQGQIAMGRGRNAFRPKLTPLRDRVSGSYRGALMALAASVVVVMLLVCANLSNLLLSRGAVRQKEMAVRAALGASRLQLMRQLLIESLVLAGSGGAFGVALAWAGTRTVAGLADTGVPLLQQVRLDLTTASAAVLATLFTGIVVGLLPAIQVSAAAPGRGVMRSGRGAIGGYGDRIRRAIIAVEVALACLLLASSGLLLRSLTRLLGVDPGFGHERLLTVRVDPGPSVDRDRVSAYFDDIVRQVSAIPGVEGVGLTDALPLGSNFGWRTWWVSPREHIQDRAWRREALIRIVDAGYLRAMGIAVQEGRAFSAADAAESEQVAIVSEALARHLWPGNNAVGRVLVTSNIERRVVGVARGVRYFGLDREPGEELYLPLKQSGGDHSVVDLVVKSAVSLEIVMPAVRQELGRVAPDLPTTEMRTIGELLDRSVFGRRAATRVLIGFAAFGLVLAALGMYAVVSYAVSQRRQEFALRMALGASPAGIRRSLLSQTAKPALIGLAVGLPAAWLAARAAQMLLFDVSPADPLTICGAVAILAVVVLLAVYVPSRRAARIDPAVALRMD